MLVLSILIGAIIGTGLAALIGRPREKFSVMPVIFFLALIAGAVFLTIN